MKKTAGAFLIMVFCIGMLASSCAGKENIDTTTSDTGEYLAEELDIDGMQLTMTDETKTDTETSEGMFSLTEDAGSRTREASTLMTRH